MPLCRAYRSGAGCERPLWGVFMAETPIAETQQGANSPARQLLAALTKASQEMEKSVSESYDYVARLNSELERVINAQLDETAEKSELHVRSQLGSISQEKDNILSQLTELRQEELKVLQSTGKELRMALVAKLDGLVTQFKSEVDSHLKFFQAQLEAAELDNDSHVDAARKALREQIPKYLRSINDEVGAEQVEIEKQHANYQTMLSQESNVSLNQLQEHSAELKARLDSEGEEFLSAVDKRAEQLIAEQTEEIQKKIKSFSEMEETTGQRIESLSAEDISYIKELPATFSDSCKQMAELQVGLHATIVKNLALQYRTEILSAAQEAEDHLQIVRADLQSILRQYQNHYSEQFENQLNKFEKLANDIASAQSGNDDGAANADQVLASIQDQFANVKKLVAENSREQVSETESYMEKSYEDFRIKLENARKANLENVEQNFKRSQEELVKLQQSSEESLQELSQKIDELDQSVNEAKELIRALDQASLDF